MTEQNTPPADDPQTGPEEEATERAEEDTPDRTAGPTKGFAVYDRTELRFIGGVESSKAKANAAVKDRKVKGHDYEVREV